MKYFDKQAFVVTTIVFGLMLIPSFLAAWGDEEGTLGSNSFYVTLSKLFYILRFPTHTILWEFFSLNAGLYFFGLLLNCMFYGLLVERFAFVFKLARGKA